MKLRVFWFIHDALRRLTGGQCAAAYRIGLAATHAHRWWCGYCRAWMSATLHYDLGELYVTCLNCNEVVCRFQVQGVAARMGRKGAA